VVSIGPGFNGPGSSGWVRMVALVVVQMGRLGAGVKGQEAGMEGDYT